MYPMTEIIPEYVRLVDALNYYRNRYTSITDAKLYFITYSGKLSLCQSSFMLSDKNNELGLLIQSPSDGPLTIKSVKCPRSQ